MATRPPKPIAAALSMLGVLLFVPFVNVGAAQAADPVQVQMTLEGCKLPDNASSCTYPDDFTTGSLGKNWAELDLVPHRLTLQNNGADQTFEIRLSADHLLGVVKGYDFITTPTATGAGCTMTVLAENVVSPTGVVGGVDKVLTTRLQIHMTPGATCSIAYAERLALGSHLYSGASLQSQVLNDDYSSAGQRTVSIPVNEIAPQEISKTATAFSTPTYTWTVTKTSPTEGVELDSCLPAPTQPNVSYTVAYTRTKVSGTNLTVSGTITLNNPAHRDLIASVTDTITVNGNPAGGGTLPDTTVLAGGTATIPYSFSIPNTTGVLANTASAVYEDPDLPDVDLSPLSTTVAVPISPTELPGTGATATLTDTETTTSGLEYERTTPHATSGFVSTDSFTESLSGGGSIAISKIVAASAPGNFDGTLTNAVSLDPAGDAAAITASVQIPIHVTAAQPTLTVDKHVDVAPATTATFPFTITNDQTGATTQLSVTILAGQITGSATATVAPSTAGYTVTEGTPPTGYDQAAPKHAGALALCGSGSIRIDDTRSRAALTITKTVTGDDAPQAGFVFHVACSDGTTATLTFTGSGSQSVTGIQTGSTCDVYEDAAPGWTSTPNGTQTVTVTTQGAAVAFANTRNTGSVSVTKAIVGDDPPAAGFTFGVSCTDGTNVVLTFTTTGTKTVDGILSGSTCTVTETPADGWTSAPAGPQTVTLGLADGATATVPFTNTRNAGTLSITKAIHGDDAPPAGFTFGVTCTDGTNVVLTFTGAGTKTVDGILSGSTCTVTETAAPGWTASPDAPQTVTLDLADGSTAAVAFTNTRNTGTVAITKAIVGDTAPPNGFAFAVSCDDGTDETVTFTAAGTKTVGGILSGSTCTVTETAAPGWTSTPAGPQTVMLDLADGSTQTVSFTNTRNLGSLSITKAIVGDVPPPAGFTFDVTCTDGTDETLTFATAGSKTIDGILSGSTCTVTEAAAPGWTSTPAGPQTVTLGLEDGSTQTVSFTNTRNLGSVEITKAVEGDDPPEAGFTFGATCTDGTNVVLTFTEAGTKTVDGILSGSTCTVTETPAPGWTSTPDAPQTVTLDLADGATQTVSFTNTRNLGSVSVTKAIVGDDPPPDGFTFGVVCDDGTEETLTFTEEGTQTVDGILSGSICTVTETAAEGWDSVPAGPQVVSLDLAAGATATVSFTNTRQPAGLSLVKTVDRTTANFGDTLTYGLTVRNTGTRPLHAVEVSDKIPAGTTYVPGSATCAAPCTASYDAITNTVHWAIGDLDPGASRSGLAFKVTIVRPAPAADGAIPSVTILNSGTTSSPPDVPTVRSNEVRTVVTAVLGVKITLPVTGTATREVVTLALVLIACGALLKITATPGPR